MKQEVTDNCRGCLTRTYGCKGTYAFLQGEECPCQLCLVKGICHSHCDPYNFYSSLYFSHTQKPSEPKIWAKTTI